MNTYLSASRGGYPDEPGYKSRSTSKAAADGVAPKARSLRQRVYDYIRDHGPATPEEIAAGLGEPLHNVRPRAAELSTRGFIEDSGLRGVAAGGRASIKWKVSK